MPKFRVQLKRVCLADVVIEAATAGAARALVEEQGAHETILTSQEFYGDETKITRVTREPDASRSALGNQSRSG